MIALTGIEKRFGDAVILRDISLTFAEGSVTALVGRLAAERARSCAASISWSRRPPVAW